MDNKITSIALKGVMALLLIIGVVLIWVALSYSNNGEVNKNQEFYKLTYKPTENALKTEEKTVVYYDYVLDHDKPAVYDLTNHQAYKYEEFINSKMKDKIKLSGFKDEEVDPVLLDHYKLNQATETVIVYAKWVMIIGLVLIAIFSILNLVQNPKRFIPTIIGIAVLGVLFFIAYSIAPSFAPDGAKVTQLSTYSPESYHWTGTGIDLFITLVIIAFVLIIIDSIMNAVRYLSNN